jgi:hypothetical protein
MVREVIGIAATVWLLTGCGSDMPASNLNFDAETSEVDDPVAAAPDDDIVGADLPEETG